MTNDAQQRIERLENQVQALKTSLIGAYRQIQSLSFQLDAYRESNDGVSIRNKCADQIETLGFIRK